MSDKIICPMTLLDVTLPYRECVTECAWRVKVINGVDTFSMCAITALAVNTPDGHISPVNYEYKKERIQ